jgi:hypothetical protein
VDIQVASRKLLLMRRSTGHVRTKNATAFETKRANTIAIAVGVVGVAATSLVGISIPIAIDNQASSRDTRQVCIKSILELRSVAADLVRGYAVNRSDEPNRLADWDAVQSGLDVVAISCDSNAVMRGDLLRTPTRGDTSSFEDVRSALLNEKELDRSGNWTQQSVDVVSQMINWTTWALGEVR